MKRGDLVRANWSDTEHQIFLVLEVSLPTPEESPYLEIGDYRVRFLEPNGSIFDTVLHDSEVQDGLFEILSE